MRDIRDTAIYQDTRRLHAAIHGPGTGQVADADELSASPDGTSVVPRGARSVAVGRTGRFMPSAR